MPQRGFGRANRKRGLLLRRTQGVLAKVDVARKRQRGIVLRSAKAVTDVTALEFGHLSRRDNAIIARRYNAGWSELLVAKVPEGRLNRSISYVSACFHCVFSTKGRQRLVTTNLAQRLWPNLSGIARENEMKALAIGGVEDHVHLLLSVPATLPIAKAMQLIKSESSRWVH